jgi:hypothetical protein
MTKVPLIWALGGRPASLTQLINPICSILPAHSSEQ